MQPDISVFKLMGLVFWGFFATLLYGAATGGAVFSYDAGALRPYLEAFFVDFNCMVAGGLTLGSAIYVWKTQTVVTSCIEAVFCQETLNATSPYVEWRRRYYSARRSVTFTVEFIFVGVFIFFAAQFPISGLGEYFLVAFGCMQYSSGVYVGRKLFYAAKMVHAVSELEPEKDILKFNGLEEIITYVNIVSTLTIIFVYVHVTSYYEGPFQFETFFGDSVQTLLLLPMVIATPVVVIFNFYPRSVLRRLYSRSIECQTERIRSALQHRDLTAFERMSYAMEYDRFCKDEMRYRLRLSLSDLPMAATIGVMLLQMLSS